MILEIPIPDKTAFFTQRVELDGVNYLLAFSLNQREDAFYLTLSDEDGAYILGPLKILTNWPMLRWHRYTKGLPPGELLAIGQASADSDGISAKKPLPASPGYQVLGKDIGFYYLDEEETNKPSTLSIAELEALAAAASAPDPGETPPEED